VDVGRGRWSAPAAHVYQVKLVRSGGGQVDFADFRGKVLLVDFFATWLNPSLVNVPRYVRLYDRYQGQGLQVVGVSLDDLGDQVLRPFCELLRVPYPVALADVGIRQGHSTFGDLGALPLLLVFDRSGKLVRAVAGLVPEEALGELVEELL
jgi:peroxiredoxin